MPSFRGGTALPQVLATVRATYLYLKKLLKLMFFLFCLYIDGDTTCVKNAIATCVNGQFHTSNGCAATQQCFALPSVKSNGTVRQPN